MDKALLPVLAYADDAASTDPFNDVRGLPAIRRIFNHRYTQVSAPCFIVTARMAGADGLQCGFGNSISAPSSGCGKKRT